MNSSSQDLSPSTEKATPKSAASFWTPERQAALVAMAADGRTGREIATELGTTRCAVLGRAHRTGVLLPMDERKRHKARPPRHRPGGERRALPLDHPTRRSRAWGGRAFSDLQIAAAIAARLAGASWRGAAEVIGASPQSLNRHWWNNPELMAQGRALYDRAREVAAREAAERQRYAILSAESERQRIARNNAPLFAQMLPKHRRICARAVAGDPLSEIGRDESLTRERIRQIVARWRSAGLIVPEARQLSDVCRHSYRPYSGVEVAA